MRKDKMKKVMIMIAVVMALVTIVWIPLDIHTSKVKKAENEIPRQVAIGVLWIVQSVSGSNVVHYDDRIELVSVQGASGETIRMNHGETLITARLKGTSSYTTFRLRLWHPAIKGIEFVPRTAEELREAN